MKSVAAVRVAAVSLIVLVAAGCAGPYVHSPYRAHVDSVLAGYPGSSKRVPAPATLEPHPWAVGQWRLYKYRHGSDLAYEKLSIVAADPCGIWIEEVLQQYDHRSKWTFCLRSEPSLPKDSVAAFDQLQVVIVQVDRAEPTVIDFRDHRNAERKANYEWIVSQLFASTFQGEIDVSRDDVDVPAGHFEQTMKITSVNQAVKVTHWLHPDVPLDGMVKLTDDQGVEKVLLAYGDRGAASVIPELATELASARKPVERSRLFFGLGYAFSWFSGGGGEASSGADGTAGRIGVRVTPRLEILGEGADIGIHRYSPDPTLSQSAHLTLLGVRWSPFGPTRARLPQLGLAEALYVRADAGYAELDRIVLNSSGVVARGLAVGAAIGWLGLQAHDWVGGIELSDHISFFNSGEGTRHSVAFMAVYELYLPWPWSR